MGSINSFEDLECWKASRDLRRFVSAEIIPKFPNEEKYTLTSQLRRSSRSISDNIAEGFGRYPSGKYTSLQDCSRIPLGNAKSGINCSR